MNENNSPSLRSLAHKLQLIAEGQELDLTPEEALIYGADYADEYPDAEMEDSNES